MLFGVGGGGKGLGGRGGVPSCFVGWAGVPPRVVFKQRYHSLSSELVKFMPTIFCRRRMDTALINFVKR